MAYLDGYYLNDHIWQYDGTPRANQNCTPATGANGARATTGGRQRRTGGQIRDLVQTWEETNPAKPGWSLYDLDKALGRLFPPEEFGVRIGYGWDRLVADRKSGLYLAVQGDEDQFSAPKCSASFDGDHCIGVHPATRKHPETGREQWWTDDPICPTGGWRDRRDIAAYAIKLGNANNTDLFYGVWTTPVPTQVNLWGADVPARLKLYNPTGWTVGQAVKEVNGGFGSVVNMSDVELALDNIHHDYGDRIDPSDLQVLVDSVK